MNTSIVSAASSRALRSSRPRAQVTAFRAKVQEGLKSKKMFLFLAETFRALGDPSRVQIVWALSQGELFVGDLAELLSISQPAVSHHLRMLRNLKLVRARRDGRTIYYSLDDEHIDRLLQEGIKHVEELL